MLTVDLPLLVGHSVAEEQGDGMSFKNVRAFWVAALAKIQSHQRDKFSACSIDNPRCLCIRSQGYSAMSAMLYVSPQIYFWEFKCSLRYSIERFAIALYWASASELGDFASLDQYSICPKYGP